MTVETEEEVLVQPALQIYSESNPFSAMARALWARGEDGELIAKELAHAFSDVAADGIGAKNPEDMAKEFLRLLTE